MAAFSGEAWEGLMDKIQQSQNSGEVSDKDLEQAFFETSTSSRTESKNFLA